MKHRGNLHAAQKGRVGLSLAILTAMAAMGMSGCSWDADLYKELVKAGDVNPCPPRILLDDHSDKYSCLVKVVYEEDGFDLVRCDEDGNDVDGGCEKNTKNQFLSIKKILNDAKKDPNGKTWKSDLAALYDEALGAVVYENTANDCVNNCKGNSVCIRECFASSFKYGLCPATSPKCDFGKFKDEGYVLKDGGEKDDTSIFYCKTDIQACTNAADCENVVSGWAGGKCDKGICKANKCEDNYHLETVNIEDEPYSTCKQNDTNCCGLDGNGECVVCKSTELCDVNKCVTQCNNGRIQCDVDGRTYCADLASEVENCGECGRACEVDESKGWAAVKCVESFCVAQTCIAPDQANGIVGYHMGNDGECIINSDTDCGNSRADCTKLPGWLNAACENGKCVAQACKDGYQFKDGECVAGCKPDEHSYIYYNEDTGSEESGCEPNDLMNCGSHEYKCSEQVAQWLDGSCVDGVCRVVECVTGYKAALDTNTCVSDCTDGQHYDSEKGKCVKDDEKNCGATGYNCWEQIKNSKDVKCSSGKCNVKSCNTGYKVADNACASDCVEGREYYDTATSKCATNDLLNCGQKGFACETKVDLWKKGACTDGICTIEECQSGFKPVANVCKADCGQNQHYNTSTSQCENNDLNNCGAVGYKCSDNVAHWSDGSCTAGVCMVTVCETGYQVKNNACISDCVTGQHYDSTEGNCVADDINNCGATGHKCSDEIKNSKTVACQEGKCTVSACATGYKVNNNVCTSDCNSSQYYDSSTAKCVASNTLNCGQKGYSCASNIKNWVEGSCTNNACIVSKCADGYKTSNNACAVNCSSGQHYDSSQSKCVGDDLNNCGAVGYKCSDRVSQWLDGSCSVGVCTLSKCNDGYKIVENACVSDCKDNQHYDNSQSKCVADDINNCGATGHKCSDEIKNSKTVACQEGKCTVSACATGYKVNNNVCTSDCDSSQYYDSSTAKCIASNISNCGQKGYNCASNIKNWADGTCTNNVCNVSKCADGYKVFNNACAVNCSSGQHYDSSLSKCVGDDLKNCGAVGYKCSDRVSQWLDGSCSAGVCTLSMCNDGYKIVENACVSDCKENQHYDNSQSKCVADDINNCGATGHACKDEIKNSKTVSCSDGKCSVTACNDNYTKTNNMCVSKCNKDTEYYDSESGSCKTSNTDNCGQSGYKCSSHIANWNGGNCTKNTCVVNSCTSGFNPVNGACAVKCSDNQHYDSSKSECVNNSLTDCGAVGYKCADRVAQWDDGTCVNGVCTVSACKTGYKVVTSTNTCASDCTSGQHYDNAQAKCVADDENNCGATGHACKDEIKNSKTVSCSGGKCSVTACNDNYTKTNNMCVSKCNKDTEYYDSESGSCKTSNTDNCGQSGYKCSEHIANWSNGSCTGNTCAVLACNSGFKPIANTCVANCGDNQYYDEGTCKTSSIDNCGQKGFKCSDNVTGWADGNCVNNKCKAASCSTGYHAFNDKCVANDNTCCGYTTGTTCNVCSSGKYCKGNECVDAGCQSGTYNCGGGCFPAATLTVLHMNTDCQCIDGYVDQNGNKADGCEQPPSDACGGRCGRDATCHNGDCVCAKNSGLVLDSNNNCVECTNNNNCGDGFRCSNSKVCKCSSGNEACTPSSQTCSNNSCTDKF